MDEFRTPEQTALLQRVCDWLAAGAPETKLANDTTLRGFDFSDWIKPAGDCGTIACIAGAIVQFADPVVIKEGSRMKNSGGFFDKWDVEGEAVDLSGMNETASELLFCPFDQDDDLLDEEGYIGKNCDLSFTRHLTPQQIAPVLQHFIDTNQVNWDIALEKTA